MQIKNIPDKIRLYLYILFGIGAFIIDYLLTKNIIGLDEVSLFSKISAFVFALAAINITPKE